MALKPEGRVSSPFQTHILGQNEIFHLFSFNVGWGFAPCSMREDETRASTELNMDFGERVGVCREKATQASLGTLSCILGDQPQPHPCRRSSNNPPAPPFLPDFGLILAALWARHIPNPTIALPKSQANSNIISCKILTSHSPNPNLISFAAAPPTTQQFCSHSRGIAGQVRKEYIFIF